MSSPLDNAPFGPPEGRYTGIAMLCRASGLNVLAIVDRKTARQAAKQGMIGAIFCAAANGAIVVAAAAGLEQAQRFGPGVWNVVMALLFALVALGLSVNSRVAAVSGLVLYVAGLALSWQRIAAAFILVALFLTFAYVNGIRGALAYHRFKAQGSRGSDARAEQDSAGTEESSWHDSRDMQGTDKQARTIRVVVVTILALIVGWGAMSLYRMGRHGRAVLAAGAELYCAEKVKGPRQSYLATSLNNLARLYHAQGQYAQGEPLYLRSLAIREKNLGLEHPEVATSLYKRSLAIWEKTLGPEHPDVATSLNNLAELYHAQGQYAKAEPLHKRSLAICEKTLGPEHPDVATSLNNLALLYGDQGRYEEAEPLCKRSLAIWEKALGPEHPNTATGLNNLAGLYHAQGQYARAAFTSAVTRRTMVSTSTPGEPECVRSAEVGGLLRPAPSSATAPASVAYTMSDSGGAAATTARPREPDRKALVSGLFRHASRTTMLKRLRASFMYSRISWAGSALRLSWTSF